MRRRGGGGEEGKVHLVPEESEEGQPVGVDALGGFLGRVLRSPRVLAITSQWVTGGDGVTG